MNKRYLTPAQIYYSLANLRQITFEVTDANFTANDAQNLKSF